MKYIVHRMKPVIVKKQGNQTCFHTLHLFIFSKLTEEKSKEKQSLMDAEKNVRSITSEKIKEMHENVGKKFMP